MRLRTHPMLSIATTLLLLQLPQPQREQEPFAVHPVATQHVATSPDDQFVAIVANATAIRVDARTQTTEDLSDRGDVASVSLGNDHSYTLGLRDGRLVHVDQNGNRSEHLVHERRTVLGVQQHEHLVAWWTVDSKAGVLDLKTGAQRFDPPLEVSIHLQYPAIRFAADGRFVACRVASKNQEADTYAVVFELATHNEVARLPCYASRGDAFAVTGPRILHAQRIDAKMWNLLAFDVESRQSKAIDGDLRGGHFVDLFASPSAKFVVEGDFEETTLVRYTLDDDATAKLEFGEDSHPLGCGTLRQGGAEVEVVLVAMRKEPSQLAAFRLDDGSRVEVVLPTYGESPVAAAGTFASGLGFWSCHWVGTGGARTRRIEFFALDAAAKRR